MHARFSRFATSSTGVTTDLDAAYPVRYVIGVDQSTTDAELGAAISREMLQRSPIWTT